eukprot:13914049-Alexandrium_andersonii.AAC.1
MARAGELVLVGAHGSQRTCVPVADRLSYALLRELCHQPGHGAGLLHLWTFVHGSLGDSVVATGARGAES